MIPKILFFVISSLATALCSRNAYHFQPEQVHLSIGDNFQEMVVTWSTVDSVPQSIVEYGVGGLSRVAKGQSKRFEDGGSTKSTQHIHTVKLTDLKPASSYVYHCGSSAGWSPIFKFKTAPNDTEHWQPSLAIYGDMGNENAQSLARLQEETQRGDYDMILHVGDFAYDMSTENGRVGDEFMRKIEEVAAYVPYMTCPGNHEEAYNFSHYRNRFNMPGDSEGFYYSFDMGPVHFISISTEVYYFMNFGIKSLISQYLWLEKDLQTANLPENRAKRPWIIVYGHRPMYCSNADNDDCTHHETLTRVGLPFVHLFGLEDLLYKNGVDVEIWAHEHSYERLWPIYDYKVYNGSLEEPYTNPKAPVHFTTGSAGCKEKVDHFVKQPYWSAFRNSDYGYTKLKVHNRTHLNFMQVSDVKKGAIVDNFWVIKHDDSPFRKNFTY